MNRYLIKAIVITLVVLLTISITSANSEQGPPSGSSDPSISGGQHPNNPNNKGPNDPSITGGRGGLGGDCQY